MSLDAWITILVVAGTLGTLIGTRLPNDLTLVGAATMLLLAGVLTPTEALAGFGNPGVITVGILYVVVAGLIDTGAVHALGARLLGRPVSLIAAQLRLMLPVTAMSAFLNNTPLVAMLVPVVGEWARRSGLSVSKLMIPLSYAAILGGSCTIIGTSTNLIVQGLLLKSNNMGQMGFFEIGAVGLPCAITGILFIMLAQRWLLPERIPPLRESLDVREYALEMLVEKGSGLIGRTVEQAGLRNLPGAFLAEIGRAEVVLPAVAPTEVLRVGDRLLFVGAVESMVDLVKTRGLVPAPEQLFEPGSPRPERCLVEVVISDTCPLVGKTIRDSRFRSRYDAVVIAVARNGGRLSGKIGLIALRPGDTLLLESRPSFMTRHARSRDFLLVSEVQGASVPRHDRAWVAIAILVAMVSVAALNILPILEAALVAGGLMIATRCTTTAKARERIDWSVLVTIGASFALGAAIEKSGVGAALAGGWLDLAGDHPWLALAAVYTLTMFLTELISNNAAAVLVFPIAQATAESLGVSFWPFVACIMMAASASFATPIGYQTNLMVYGPGGYRFTDYLRIGVPLNLLLGTVTVTLAPAVWPF
ncbi:MAG: SLC13 family permease [Gammaproteobacteria bacterium]